MPAIPEIVRKKQNDCKFVNSLSKVAKLLNNLAKTVTQNNRSLVKQSWDKSPVPKKEERKKQKREKRNSGFSKR